ncbi:Amino acid ABC transporter, substrate-binding protein [Pseudomonas sp. R2-37-08W]|uniref:transporter substrate-binding domain-containing protein n=1 Tax=unclassified Pseudomonas TaxID=196821 RepID=UPI000F58EA1B|nr:MULTISPECIES: transporter substrate-binding domain-containing protein [unclassified Pseudomonas]AZF08618.1 Amino acid ABC transporter, substrate-binding protein [Pseudomonas sp. R2-37-08W]AZF45654.1 Amino acid ABC transporter, substrate-binding protein [Pseudomonas sp. R2-7-07]AZF50883.1 Amino acid ABC transporter, substrate-binding protein [Pseudomonas sp. R4-34-07]AZF56298.1 Amino acid ABC transporter, substrate-binding protein [Pseudomonas sp. R11-23-07]
MFKRYGSALLMGVVALIHTGLLNAGAIDDAVRRGVLKVGTTPTYVPFEMTDRQGRVVGFEIDLLHAMSRALGVELELVTVPYTELLSGLITKKFDLIGSGMTVTQERNLKLNFSDSFIVVGQTVLLHPRLAGTVSSIEDLDEASYRIAVTEGTTGEAAAQRFLGAARLMSFVTPEEGVREVVEGRADAFIYDAPYNLIAMARPENSALLTLEQPFTFEPLAFGLKKGDYDSLNWINHFLNQVAQDGTYDQLHDKWFKDTAWIAEIDLSS